MSRESVETVPNTEALTPMAREVLSKVSDEEPWALLERFSELERVSGSADERAAAEYITDRLESFGVAYERYDPELYISQPHDASLKTIDRPFEPGPVKTISFSASTTVSGEVVYVGEAGSDLLSDEDADTTGEPYADVGDLSGKIALTSAGFLSIEATRVLERKGAAGIITIHPHEREPHDGIATPVWGGAPTLDQADDLPAVPIVNVNAPDGEVLKGWAEEDRPFHAELETDLTTDWFECPVVVAEIEAGTDTDEFALVHGHYDSWHAGVTDNATGDAGLLELARVFETVSDQLDRNLRVAWWPGHSTGRYAGSTWYADEFALEIHEHCVAQVNMDSPGARDASEYTDMSCWTPETHELVGGAIEDAAGAPYEEQFPFRAGDYSFDNLGVTGFFMLSSNIPADVREQRGYHQVGGCGGNSDAWHVSTDSLDKAGREELVRDIRVYALSLLRVLTADVLPFDHRRYVDRLQETVAEYDAAAGDAFSFEPTREALGDLADRVDSFYRAVEDGTVPAESANEAIVDLARILNRLYLVSEGRFEQDPATGRDPMPLYAPARRVPTLDDDETRFLRVQLKRAQNRVLGELREADRLVSGVLDDE